MRHPSHRVLGRSAVGAAVLLIVASCASNATQAPGSPSPSAATDPNRASAGAAYLAAASSYNATVESLFTEYEGATSLNYLQEYCVKLGANEHTFETTLEVIPLPSAVVADMAALTSDLATDETAINGCAVATTVVDWQAAWDLRNSKPARTSDLANVVRRDLGLPPTPTPSPS